MNARTIALATAMNRAPPGYLSVERIAELSGLSVAETRAEIELWTRGPTALSAAAETVKAVLDATPAGKITVEQIAASLRTALVRRGLEELARAGYIEDGAVAVERGPLVRKD